MPLEVRFNPPKREAGPPLSATFATTPPAVCTAEGGTNGSQRNLVKTGNCNIRADQAGNASYAAAPAVERHLFRSN